MIPLDFSERVEALMRHEGITRSQAEVEMRGSLCGERFVVRAAKDRDSYPHSWTRSTQTSAFAVAKGAMAAGYEGLRVYYRTEDGYLVDQTEEMDA